MVFSVLIHFIYYSHYICADFAYILLFSLEQTRDLDWVTLGSNPSFLLIYLIYLIYFELILVILNPWSGDRWSLILDPVFPRNRTLLDFLARLSEIKNKLLSQKTTSLWLIYLISSWKRSKSMTARWSTSTTTSRTRWYLPVKGQCTSKAHRATTCHIQQQIRCSL